MPRHATDRRRVRMLTAGAFGALAVVTLVLGHRFSTGQRVDATVAVTAVVLTVMAFSVGAPGRRYDGLPLATGRVVAVIPAFNENPRALFRTIVSLLNGTRPPDEIHVVDDGSDVVLPPLAHPSVFWYRTENGGKRRAQAHALRRVQGADFVLTVDSDCTVERDALAHLLRAMSDPRVQAATGLPLARNPRTWLARVIDLEIASICLTYRVARSMLGSLTTCSGALSLYRAGVVLDNLEEYASDHKGSGDDRRLTHYAMLRGHVVSVAEAVVHTDMPATVRTLYRQRVRWSSSHWRYAFWEVSHLPFGPMLWTCYNQVLAVIVPLALAWALLAAPLLGHGVHWKFLVYWTLLGWFLNLRYAVARPHMRAADRWLIWLLGTPMHTVLHLTVVRPAMIHALFTLRSATWGTRTATKVHGRYRARRPGYRLAV